VCDLLSRKRLLARNVELEKLKFIDAAEFVQRRLGA
jgi:hypothetical protein